MLHENKRLSLGASHRSHSLTHTKGDSSRQGISPRREMVARRWILLAIVHSIARLQHFAEAYEGRWAHGSPTYPSPALARATVCASSTRFMDATDQLRAMTIDPPPFSSALRAEFGASGGLGGLDDQAQPYAKKAVALAGSHPANQSANSNKVLQLTEYGMSDFDQGVARGDNQGSESGDDAETPTLAPTTIATVATSRRCHAEWLKGINSPPLRGRL